MRLAVSMPSSCSRSMLQAPARPLALAMIWVMVAMGGLPFGEARGAGCSATVRPRRASVKVHHSVINAIKAFGLDFRFVPTPYEPRFEALLPPSVDEVREGLRRYPEALAVLYTSPTYEGLAANTRSIADAVHAASPHAMVIVDEAWGGHLHFHPDLPDSAMEAGADVCVQSTHKLAGGLQQTGLIHWRTGRVDPGVVEGAFLADVTTSPSDHPLATAGP